jgi:type IV secretion system protein VirB9
MSRLILAAVVLGAAAAPVVAQIQPHPSGGDPHLQVVDYAEGQTVQLRGVPGYQLMVELSPDEQIRNVALGDNDAWQVSTNHDGDRLFLKPVDANGATNMTVVTSVRTYTFDLIASGGASSDTPYTVQFRYRSPPQPSEGGQYVDVSAVARRMSHYRITGDRLLRPSAVTDDGLHTFVSWPKNAPIPAVYAPDRSGTEVLLNGMMGTDDVYVVDGAPQRLIFRIDRSVARADRVNPRKAR